MKAFKLLVTQNGRLSSISALGPAHTYYQSGVNNAPDWLAEQGYHLCVFRTLDALLSFLKINVYYEAEIWEVEGELVPLQSRAWLFALSNKELIVCDAWKWPPETEMMKNLTLVKKIGKTDLHGKLEYTNKT